MELKTELGARHDRMNVTDSGNAGFYNDIDPESLIWISYVMADTRSLNKLTIGASTDPDWCLPQVQNQAQNKIMLWDKYRAGLTTVWAKLSLCFCHYKHISNTLSVCFSLQYLVQRQYCKTVLMENLISKYLPTELLERQKIHQDEMAELSKWVCVLLCSPSPSYHQVLLVLRALLGRVRSNPLIGYGLCLSMFDWRNTLHVNMWPTDLQ